MIAYLATYKPFESPNDKNVAIFNLTALIILTDQVFWFTAYVPLKHRARFGLYYTATFQVVMLINFWQIISLFIPYCKKYYFQCKHCCCNKKET